MPQLLGQLAVLAVLLLLGFIVGRAAEWHHLKRLAAGESRLTHMLVTDIRSFPGGADPALTPVMVTGGAVIATDYFKSFLARLRKIIGGELRSYESLMTRARREAVLRMLEEAHTMGFDAVCNVRLNSADIGGMTGKRGAAMVEAFASGTAYRRPRPASHEQSA